MGKKKETILFLNHFKASGLPISLPPPSYRHYNLWLSPYCENMYNVLVLSADPLIPLTLIQTTGQQREGYASPETS